MQDANKSATIRGVVIPGSGAFAQLFVGQLTLSPRNKRSLRWPFLFSGRQILNSSHERAYLWLCAEQRTAKVSHARNTL